MFEHNRLKLYAIWLEKLFDLKLISFVFRKSDIRKQDNSKCDQLNFCILTHAIAFFLHFGVQVTDNNRAISTACQHKYSNIESMSIIGQTPSQRSVIGRLSIPENLLYCCMNKKVAKKSFDNFPQYFFALSSMTSGEKFKHATLGKRVKSNVTKFVSLSIDT